MITYGWVINCLGTNTVNVRIDFGGNTCFCDLLSDEISAARYPDPQSDWSMIHQEGESYKS